MSTSVLICDDSKFARQMMAQSLPANWDIVVEFAENGQQALEKISQGKGDVMFLDLNMPVMDGYQTMAEIKRSDLPTMVIVVSGDVQDEARNKMLSMGAIDFIRKPIDQSRLCDILSKYGTYEGVSAPTENKFTFSLSSNSSIEEKIEAYRELANIAMGRAGKSLGRLLNEFISLPIPNVTLLHANELQTTLAQLHQHDSVSAISKGFTHHQLSGEAILLFNDSDVQSMSRLRGNTSQSVSQQQEIELLMDIANILIGAYLNALETQLRLTFTQSTPIVLGMHSDLLEIMKVSKQRVDNVLAIEIAYAIEARDISFELLLLIPEAYIDKGIERLMSSQR